MYLKKVAALVLSISASTVFAGAMGPTCSPGNVTVPCEGTAWDVGITALYLEPLLSTNWGYHSIAADPIGPSITNSFDHPWDWGYALEGSYHFNTGNDITVSWYHLDTDSSGNYDVSSTPTIAPTRFTIEDKWNAINGEFGQFVNFSANKKIRFHGGVQYAQLSSVVQDYIIESNRSLNGHSSQFKGFGPRTGIDMNYLFGNGFGIYAKAAAAILVGTGKFSQTADRSGLLLTPTVGSRNTIVPELEGKLGVRYDFALSLGNLSIDGGYMWYNYFDALQHINTLEYGVPGDGILDVNFGGSGPYLGAKLLFNA